MKTLFEIFENRQLSRNQAKLIAESQHDLGGPSKIDMAVALGGLAGCKNYSKLMQARMEAYERLDDLSKYIVKQLLMGDIQDGFNHINYSIKNLQAVAGQLYLLLD